MQKCLSCVCRFSKKGLWMYNSACTKIQTINILTSVTVCNALWHAWWKAFVICQKITIISYKHRIRGNLCTVSLCLGSPGGGLGQKVESKDLQKVWCWQVPKKRGGSFTVKLRNTILPELSYKCDAQVEFLDLATIWSTNNMSNDKCVDSPYKAIQCPVSLNCKFCLNPKEI